MLSRLITVFAMIPAEVRDETGGRSWSLRSMWSRTRSNSGSRAMLRMLAESIDGIIKTRRRQRSGRYSIYTFGGGRLPDLISFSSKLARIVDILSHQVGPDDVWREMIEKESFEQKTFIFVNSVGQEKQGAQLRHQCGGLLIGGQGEGHECLILLERVEGVELGEALPEGLVGQLIWRELNEVHYMSCICMALTAN